MREGMHLHRIDPDRNMVRRGDQGARAASIRMRLRRGWGDGGVPPPLPSTWGPSPVRRSRR